jgi:hypothetical protein
MKTAYAIYNATTKVQRGPAYESEDEAQQEADALNAAPNLPDIYLVELVELQAGTAYIPASKAVESTCFVSD